MVCKIGKKIVRIYFRHVGDTTYCTVRIKKTLRVGCAVCSDEDAVRYSENIGAEIALERALAQHTLHKKERRVIWGDFFKMQNDEAKIPQACEV